METLGYLLEIAINLYLIPIPVIGLVVKFVSFGLIPENVCIIIGGLIWFYLPVRFVANIVVASFGYLSFKDYLIQQFKKYKEKKVRADRYTAQNHEIKNKFEEMLNESGIVKDVDFIEEIKLPNRKTLLNNDDKYIYVNNQLEEINGLINKSNHLFKVTKEGLIHTQHIPLNQIKRYTEKDCEFINQYLPLNLDQIKPAFNKRNLLLKEIKDLQSEAVFQKNTTAKGKFGEDSVLKILNLYKDQYTILSNIRVELDGSSSESDFIIVCDKGVFVLEVKNHGSENDRFEIAEDGLWTIIKNGKREIRDNVAEQNNRHCAINQTILNRELKARGIDTDYIKCKSIIVLANNKVLISNKSLNVVVRPSEIITYIENLNVEERLSKDLQQEIANIFKSVTLPAKTYSVNDNAQKMAYAINEYEKLTNELILSQEMIKIYNNFF